jgi:hypothetical protein
MVAIQAGSVKGWGFEQSNPFLNRKIVEQLSGIAGSSPKAEIAKKLYNC